MGDLSSNSFKEVWKSIPYHNFRIAVMKGRSEIDICKNCTEGTKVFA
ncbi:MAG: SPASM domain-containing protein [Bacteroidota bacterium]